MQYLETGGTPPPPHIGFDWRGGSGDGPEGRGVSRQISLAGVAVLIVSTGVVFAALTVAFGMRRASAGWQAFPIPSVIPLNTAILVASSVVLHQSRRALNQGLRIHFNRWWTAGTALGGLFS